jgi:hypothetical protein
VPFSLAAPAFADFDLTVQAQAVEGPLDNGYGVIFRRQVAQPRTPGTTWSGWVVSRAEDLLLGSTLANDGYYLFLVSSDGYYQVSRRVNGADKVLSAWIESPVVNPGFDQPNTLRVVARGSEFQFYVNGELVPLCIPDDPESISTYALGSCIQGQMLDTLVDDSLSSGQVGVVAQSFNEPGVVVEFDNLVMFSPQTAN